MKLESDLILICSSVPICDVQMTYADETSRAEMAGLEKKEMTQPSRSRLIASRMRPTTSVRPIAVETYSCSARAVSVAAMTS